MRLVSRLTPRPDHMRRLALAGAAVAATAAIGLGLGTAPASAKDDDPCATAKAIVRADLNEARFWILELDGLAEAKLDWLADQAASQRDRWMDQAAEDYKSAKAACPGG
jgi:hypothetical protein